MIFISTTLLDLPGEGLYYNLSTHRHEGYSQSGDARFASYLTLRRWTGVGRGVHYVRGWTVRTEDCCDPKPRHLRRAHTAATDIALRLVSENEGQRRASVEVAR